MVAFAGVRVSVCVGGLGGLLQGGAIGGGPSPSDTPHLTSTETPPCGTGQPTGAGLFRGGVEGLAEGAGLRAGWEGDGGRVFGVGESKACIWGHAVVPWRGL